MVISLPKAIIEFKQWFQLGSNSQHVDPESDALPLCQSTPNKVGRTVFLYFGELFSAYLASMVPF